MNPIYLFLFRSLQPLIFLSKLSLNLPPYKKKQAEECLIRCYTCHVFKLEVFSRCHLRTIHSYNRPGVALAYDVICNRLGILPYIHV